MAVFTCKLKSDHGGLQKGTIIQVSTSLATPDDSTLKKALEAQYGKRAGEAGHTGYWEITKN